MASQAVHDIPNIRKYAAPSDKPVDIGGHGPGSAHVHVTSPFLLLSVYGILVILTVATVAVTLGPDLGDLNVWVALAIAMLKAGLVAFYFMHLRWDSPFNGIVMMISLFFVSLFIGIAVLDSKEYQKNDKGASSQVMP